MPKFVIERGLPGAGSLTADELQSISQKSVEVLDSMAGRAQWLQTCNAVRRVGTIIDPTTAEVS